MRRARRAANISSAFGQGIGIEQLMKILVKNDVNLTQTEFWFNYLRDVIPGVMNDVVLIDLSRSDIIKEWASSQHDFTYIYFEDKITYGKAFNEVIRDLGINEDILITDCYHIPLSESYDRLLDGLYSANDSFAVGPVSNTFGWEQNIKWTDAEDALNWSEKFEANIIEEVLNLNSGIILISEKVINTGNVFADEAVDFDSMIAEKLIREYLNHYRMYVCKHAGVWDVRGNDYIDVSFPDTSLLKEKFNMHYLNVRGNTFLINLLKECDGLEEDVRILEIGCDCGGTLFDLKKVYKNAELYGTDINKDALRFASEFAQVKVNDIENYNLDFCRNDFDIIIFVDVLEHLREPLETLKYCKRLLKRGGRIAASIPNVMNIEVVKHILDGNFPYSDYGLLDRTHIHMFTFNEIVRMFEKEAGFKIEKISMNGTLDENDDRLADELVRLGKAEKFMYQAYQYQIVAKAQA